ncbi:MaoC family dehydratase N-terminal domain-containing protein [Sinobaca sp. H24]|uniref:FAS1-like dehydratase domain-containing protein n=1 Tax=Sinobaca sp. H24 TaxID=2923376 RepID=UPI00207A3B84|nr:MaoC family dehydratase N-terminal domain-containing protein [Sinobaca sp. H24]
MIKPGDIFREEKTFQREEVRHFAEITGDTGKHHMEEDEKGRVMVHGLLTASIGTKIGGDLHYIARELNSEFLRPVFSGDTVTCELEILTVDKQEARRVVSLRSTYRNQDGKEVLRGTSSGVILDS